MDDEDHRPISEPDPQPPTDAATQAFAHLAARVAGMEERLDGRMAMMTRALEHIAIEKQSFDTPITTRRSPGWVAIWQTSARRRR